MSGLLRTAVFVLAGLAALYGAGWFYLAGRFSEAVGTFLDAQRAQGLDIARAGMAKGGFPLRLEARLAAPSVRFAAAGKKWVWTPARAVFSAAPWALDRVTLDLAGGHALAAADAADARRWMARADELALETTLRGAVASGFVLVGRGIAAANSSAADEDFAVARLNGRWRRAEVPPVDHLGESQSFEIAAGGVRIPARARLPLGPEIARFKIAGRVLGELLSLNPGMGPGALGSWRDGGGTVELAGLDARYGALVLAGEGTVALDGELQPIAALTARIEGFSETIDALRERGAMPKRDAATAKLILAALATRAADGRLRLAVPVTLQDGTLFAGPVAILRVPPIPW